MKLITLQAQCQHPQTIEAHSNTYPRPEPRKRRAAFTNQREGRGNFPKARVSLCAAVA